MKKFFKSLYNHLLLTIVFMLIFFWAGFFATELFKNKPNEYYVSYVFSNELTKEDITASFFKENLANKWDSSNNPISYSYSTVKPDEIFEANDFTIKIKAKYFITSSVILTNDSYQRFQKVINKVFLNHHGTLSSTNTFAKENYFNGYYAGLISLGIGAILYFSLFIVIFIKFKNIELIDIYDGSSIHKYPIGKKYWLSSIRSLTRMRVFDVCLIGILFSLQIVCKLIHIPSGFANLGLGITYLVFAFICLLYGPIWGLIIGALSDVIGAFMTPSSFGFHFCYTVQAMITGFVYGLFLYKTDVTFTRCLGARIIINLIINGIIGSFLYCHLTMPLKAIIEDPAKYFNAVGIYMIGISLPKNIIFLIPQSLLLFIFIRAVLPIVKGRGLVSDEVIDVHRLRRKGKIE